MALSLNGVGSFLWDLDTGLLRFDEVGLSVLGFTPGEYDERPESVCARMPPQDPPGVGAQVDRALRERTGYSVYFRMRHGDGSLRWTHAQGRVVADARGRPAQVVGIVRSAGGEEMRAAVEAQELREARSDRRRQADMVRDVAEALARTVTVEDVAEALTGAALMARTGASGVLLALEENGRARLVGAAGFPTGLVRGVHPMPSVEEALPLSEAIRSRRAAFFTDAEDFRRRYPRLAPHVEGMPETAAAFLPLIAQGSPIGAVGLAYQGKSGFTDDERTVLEALSSVIAQSLQRALLYDKAHEVATGLQTAMLPGRLPHTPGLDLAARYWPAGSGQDIGGDWYDAVPLPDGRIAAVVGDVQGHDVRAAAVMGQLRIALRAYAAEGHPPSTSMARASAFLAELDTERFATCTLVVLDPVTGAAEMVRAGHLEPVVRGADGVSRWLQVPGGLPLGIFAPTARLAYPVTETLLEPGATMLLSTDGLIESRAMDVDSDRDQLTEAMTSGPLRSDALADHLLRTMASYTGQEDDVALLLIRRPRRGRPAVRPSFTARVTPSTPRTLRHARQALREHLHRWSMDAVADTAELLASELITNALLHTSGEATLTATPVRRKGRALRLEVADPSPVTPHRRAAPEESTSGRGLLLIEELATAWGVESRGGGKSVWCELPVSDR